MSNLKLSLNRNHKGYNYRLLHPASSAHFGPETGAHFKSARGAQLHQIVYSPPSLHPRLTPLINCQPSHSQKQHNRRNAPKSASQSSYSDHSPNGGKKQSNIGDYHPLSLTKFNLENIVESKLQENQNYHQNDLDTIDHRSVKLREYYFFVVTIISTGLSLTSRFSTRVSNLLPCNPYLILSLE